MSEPIYHGGGLDDAMARHGGTRADWLDLSTGINPNAWPIPEIDPASWQRLPDREAESALIHAAGQYYGVPDGMAIVAASLALLAVCVNTGYGWQGYLVSFLTVVLVPITLSQISLVLVRSYLPKHFFVYVLGNGFLTAWLVGYVSGHLALQLLVYSGAYTMAELSVTIVPFFPLMFFPEALINGWIITMLVVFYPAWVHSFSDEQYIHGK